jgi:hypothetical protein
MQATRIAEPCPVKDRQTRGSFLASIDDVRSYGENGFLGPLGHGGDAPATHLAPTIPTLLARVATCRHTTPGGTRNHDGGGTHSWSVSWWPMVRTLRWSATGLSRRRP